MGYMGREFGATEGDEQCRVHFALAYPDACDIDMSHPGSDFTVF